MNGRNRGIPGLARGFPGIAGHLAVLAGHADRVLRSNITAAQLARLNARFPGWRITRTASGTFRARHRTTGERLHGRTVQDLETRLLERLAARALRQG